MIEDARRSQALTGSADFHGLEEAPGSLSQRNPS
jgi:hypothetical protein